VRSFFTVNPLTPELNPSAQSCLPRFFTGIVIFEGLTARRLFKSFDVKGLTPELTFKKTERRPLHLKTQPVPPCKHFISVIKINQFFM
jgi:hypothetical protein